ncbi:MAG: 16S rRNA (cytosine(1402)-N(4))-methyltransferase RsmH [Candidatus Competibacteraceae bacterium]|jgi:16S rRNA (cytosine1402-N4)-methyltransferase|nr:16S rRNA (cytosine(1402)-N(4))-methyltransferase RsmH [Candidatus Competibacteraceae bacterium]
MDDSVPLTHQPVMLQEVLAGLAIRPDGVYVDGTFGRGGHSAAILAALGETGWLLALDRDPQAGQFAQTQFGNDPRFIFERCPFGRLAEVAERHGFNGRVHGILLDVGVSSPQLDNPQRGFSFVKEGPLDMRMDPTTGESAAQWLAHCSEETLSQVLKTLGEERFHRRIARAVTQARLQEPLSNTLQLARIISAAVPTREPGKHPATRSFQAIRIFLNQELEELQTTLQQTLQLLAPAGRLVVISFHSLEDRLVKRFIREQVNGPGLPHDLPVTQSQLRTTLKQITRAVRPSPTEVARNPRARSAVMRVAERLA